MKKFILLVDADDEYQETFIMTVEINEGILKKIKECLNFFDIEGVEAMDIDYSDYTPNYWGVPEEEVFDIYVDPNNEGIFEVDEFPKGLEELDFRIESCGLKVYKNQIIFDGYIKHGGAYIYSRAIELDQIFETTKP